MTQAGSGSETADDVPAVHFVNHLQVRLSLSDVRFDLSRHGADDGLLGALWRFATTPDHLVTMHNGLGVAIDSYRARYGEIHAVHADPASVRFDERGPNG